MLTVRRLVADDALTLKALRLRALRDAPSAFGSTYEREVAFSDEVWRDRLRAGGNPHFVAFSHDEPVVGMVAIMPDPDAVSCAGLVGMWVESAARGTGVADTLINVAIDHARAAGFTTMRLWITEGNDRAEGCYQRHGFARTGIVEIRDRDNETEAEMTCDLQLNVDHAATER